MVSFSGGRDSSALLAVLTRVARRDGFEPPVAVTARWPGDATSDEAGWQRHVIDQLEITDWEIVHPGDDLDLLGPVATAALSQHGLMWPAPAYAFMPMIERARGGTLVTGEGGDDVFGLWQLGAVWDCVRTRRRLPRRHLRALVAAALPAPVRARREFAKAVPYQNWLRGETAALYRRALAIDAARQPLLWPAYLAAVAADRGLASSTSTLQRLCLANAVTFAAPLLAPQFLSALAALGGVLGLGGRSSAMTAVFGSVLDERILTRVSKATFGKVFWGPASRAFADTWDGSGFDSAGVDQAALRDAWRAELPVYGAAMPLHAAWLASSSRGLNPSTPTPQG